MYGQLGREAISSAYESTQAPQTHILLSKAYSASPITVLAHLVGNPSLALCAHQVRTIQHTSLRPSSSFWKHTYVLKDAKMSGLEAIAALSLACNILQIVDLGRQTVDLIRTVYEGRKPDEELDRHAVTLETLADEVKKDSSKTPGPKTRLEESLLQTAAKCVTAAKDLREEVQFLVGNAKQGNLVSALKVAGKVTWRKRRLNRLSKQLDDTAKLMRSSLLANIW